MEYCKLGEIRSSRIVMGCMRIADKPLLQTEKVMVEAIIIYLDMIRPIVVNGHSK